MDTMHLRVFQSQVAFQCKCALMAAADIDRSVANRQNDGLFNGIQNLLNAAANISKALWGSGGKLNDKRKALRDSLEVPDNSPLREAGMRNNFEHMDERIDRWWSEASNHNIADFNVGPIPMITGFEDIERFREYDPATSDVVFWGQKYNIKEIVGAIATLLPIVTREADKPHWDA